MRPKRWNGTTTRIMVGGILLAASSSGTTAAALTVLSRDTRRFLSTTICTSASCRARSKSTGWRSDGVLTAYYNHHHFLNYLCRTPQWSCLRLLSSAATFVDEHDSDSDVWSYSTSSSSSAAQASISEKLEVVRSEMRRLVDGGMDINCNSHQQVATAIFGGNNDDRRRSTSKTILKQIIAGDFPDIDMSRRELAALVLECRDLQKQLALAAQTTASHSLTGSNAKNPPSLATTLVSNDDTYIDEEEYRSNDEWYNPLVSVTPDSVSRSSRDSTGSTTMYEDLIEDIFHSPKNRIHSYWKDVLLQISRPSARALVSQLDPKQCPMGYDPLAAPSDPMRSLEATSTASPGKMATATTTAGKKGSFLAYCREQKETYPDCIILTRCGDFYETFGIDAILLVEYCGLNAMAGKAKAGCPIRNIQATLDCLTQAGFRVAVYEEGTDTDASSGPGATAGAKARIKSRFLAQIVSSASPTYLYDLVLLGNCADTLASGPSSRPYVGVISSRAGYTLAEVWVEERSVRISERLTSEAVACRLAAYPPADPLLFVPSFSEYESTSSTIASLPFLPSRTDTATTGPGVRLRTRILPPTLVQQEGSGVNEVVRSKNIIVSALLQLTEGRQVDEETASIRRVSADDFTLVASSIDACSATYTQTSPLHLETANQLGLMNDRAIPSLVSYILPDFAPAATRRFFRRFLLTPPPPIVGEAMATVVGFLKQEGAPALPPMSIPPVGKVLAMVRAGQASAQVYSELLHALDSTTMILDVLAQHGSVDVVNALMVLLEHESGMAADSSSLRLRCRDAIHEIEDVLCPIHHVNSGHDALVYGDFETVSNFGDLIPRAYFDRNEAAWRGRVRPHAAPDAYDKVQEAAQRLAQAVAADFWDLEWTDSLRCFDSEKEGRKNLIAQDVFNNLFALKEIPPSSSKRSNFIHPIDRNGKVLRNRYTTPAVQAAMSDYVTASDNACEAVSDALVRLSQKLHDEGHIPAIVQASHANLILSAAFHHTVKATSAGWNLAKVVESTKNDDCAGHFNSVWPYWMDRTQAVPNTFDLSGMWVLTAPNMSGKSTIMRSTAAAALLSVCGLCAPLKSGSTIRRFDHIFVRGASSDVPTEHKSAFGAEMGDIASLLRCGGKKSLVFVDELGRGTSPQDGTRLSGAVLEAMASAGMSGVFATHLHGILQLPLKSSDRIVTKRMAIHEKDVSGHEKSGYVWTYRLEDGVCTDSMALVTAERFGLPAHVIQRAEALAQFVAPIGPVRSLPQIDNVDQHTTNSLHTDEITRVVEETTGQKSVQLAPHWNVPATFDGKSAVYVLKLNCNPPQFYVGETDNIRQRIEQHRSKGGHWSDAEALLVPSPEGKSQARMWESQLIRRMASAGFAMRSTSDGRKLRSMNYGQYGDD